MVEQRYRAVLDVLDGVSVTDVAGRNGVTRQTVHSWLRRYGDSGWRHSGQELSSRELSLSDVAHIFVPPVRM